MEPTISINYLAVGACVAVGLVLGFTWFGPVFGRAWAKQMGMSDKEPPGATAMVQSMINFAVASFLIAYVFAHSIDVWRQWAGGTVTSVDLALQTAVFTWAGFFVPLQMGRAAWEGRSWCLVAINAGHDLLRLLVFGFILAFWTA